MKIGGEELDSTTATPMINVKHGCELPDACIDVVCPDQSVCKDIWDDYTCECDNGRYMEAPLSVDTAGCLIHIEFSYTALELSQQVCLSTCRIAK